MTYQARRPTGFTLIELMVTLVILGFVLAVGIPGMRTLMNNMSVRSTSDQLMNTLQYARGQAVARVVNVSVCPGTACGGSWSTGWAVFTDDNGDGLITAPNDEIIRVEDISQSNVTVTPVPAGVVTFDNQGQNTDNNQIVFTISVTGVPSRTVTVNNMGTINAQ